MFVMLRGGKCFQIILTNSRYMDKAWEYKFFEPWLNDGLLNSSGVLKK